MQRLTRSGSAGSAPELTGGDGCDMLIERIKEADQMKILVVLTGGTIGSAENEGVISVCPEKCRVVELYRRQFPQDDTEFVTESPYSVLSENLCAGHWEKLLGFMLAYNLNGFDGVIVAHGSDTLSYTSAMLGLCLHGLEVPVVVTASDYVPDDPRSNALTNFKAAVDLIAQTRSGVFTIYRNPAEQYAQVFIPTQLKEADRINDCFYSTNDLSFAAVRPDGQLREYAHPLSVAALEQRERFSLPAYPHFEKSVRLIHPYPSMDYTAILSDDTVGAVLHVTYHSGTISGQAVSLLERCRDKQIPFYLCSLKSSARAVYETGNMLLNAGALPLYDIGTESAYAKLLLAVNFFPENIDGFMKKDIYFEQTISCFKK